MNDEQEEPQRRHNRRPLTIAATASLLAISASGGILALLHHRSNYASDNATSEHFSLRRRQQQQPYGVAKTSEADAMEGVDYSEVTDWPIPILYAEPPEITDPSAVADPSEAGGIAMPSDSIWPVLYPDPNENEMTTTPTAPTDTIVTPEIISDPSETGGVTPMPSDSIWPVLYGPNDDPLKTPTAPEIISDPSDGTTATTLHNDSIEKIQPVDSISIDVLWPVLYYDTEIPTTTTTMGTSLNNDQSFKLGDDPTTTEPNGSTMPTLLVIDAPFPTDDPLAPPNCSSGAQCFEEGSRCTDGTTQTCCGETFDAMRCDCENWNGNLEYMCMYMDECMESSCETATTATIDSTSKATTTATTKPEKTSTEPTIDPSLLGDATNTTKPKSSVILPVDPFSLAPPNCSAGAQCVEEGSRCTDGTTTTCCGETYDAMRCDCENVDGNLEYMCMFMDECMESSCETFTTATIGSTSATASTTTTQSTKPENSMSLQDATTTTKPKSSVILPDTTAPPTEDTATTATINSTATTTATTDPFLSDANTTESNSSVILPDTTAPPTEGTLAPPSCGAGAQCFEEGSSCTDGTTETCCGETFDAMRCDCENVDGKLEYMCMFTEACMMPSCETTTTTITPSTLSSAADAATTTTMTTTATTTSTIGSTATTSATTTTQPIKPEKWYPIEVNDGASVQCLFGTDYPAVYYTDVQLRAFTLFDTQPDCCDAYRGCLTLDDEPSDDEPLQEYWYPGFEDGTTPSCIYGNDYPAEFVDIPEDAVAFLFEEERECCEWFPAACVNLLVVGESIPTVMATTGATTSFSSDDMGSVSTNATFEMNMTTTTGATGMTTSLATGATASDSAPTSTTEPTTTITPLGSCTNCTWHESTKAYQTCTNSLSFPSIWDENEASKAYFFFDTAEDCCATRFPQANGTCSVHDVLADSEFTLLEVGDGQQVFENFNDDTYTLPFDLGSPPQWERTTSDSFSSSSSYAFTNIPQVGAGATSSLTLKISVPKPSMLSCQAKIDISMPYEHFQLSLNGQQRNTFFQHVPEIVDISTTLEVGDNIVEFMVVNSNVLNLPHDVAGGGERNVDVFGTGRVWLDDCVVQ